MLLSPVIRADSFHRICTRQYIFLSQLWTYYKSLLTGISAKSTARKVFDFKKLKTIVKISICYDCKHYLSQISFAIQKWTLLSLMTSCSGLLHVSMVVIIILCIWVSPLKSGKWCFGNRYKILPRKLQISKKIARETDFTWTKANT